MTARQRATAQPSAPTGSSATKPAKPSGWFEVSERRRPDSGWPVHVPDPDRVMSLLARVGCHVYSGHLLPDGSFEETFTGPGLADLLGGDPPPGMSSTEAWESAVHREDFPAYLAMGESLPEGEAVELEYRLLGFDGRTRWVLDRMWLGPVIDSRQLVDGVVTDVTDSHARARQVFLALQSAQAANRALAEARHRAEQQAGTDELTGLLNRRRFAIVLGRLLDRSDASEGVGMLLLDLDHFKRINDGHGHQVGDEALVALADCLREQVRPTDVLARWGGEEFVLALPGTGRTGALRERAEQIRAAVAEVAVPTTGEPITLRASLGGVVARHGDDLDTLISAADGALYRAKRRGRNRVVITRSAPAGQVLLPANLGA